MPYMIRISVERLNCVTLRLSNTLFIYVLKLHNHGVRCYKTSSREQIIQNKVLAFKELQKGTPHKDVASLFGVPKIPYRHEKRTKTKSLKSMTAVLFQKE